MAIDLQQWHCRNSGEKDCCNWFVAMTLPKQEGKKNCCNWFVTMALSKQKEKEKEIFYFYFQ